MKSRFLKPIKDQFFRGLTGGLIAGILKDVPDLFLVDLFGIKRLAFWDYIGEMIFNQIPKSWLDHLIAFSIQVPLVWGWELFTP